MVKTLAYALSQLTKKRILILGDLVVDIYTMGSVQRISPEAPVAVMRVEKERFLPGMAGNVAINCASLGCEAFLMARVGDDAAGSALLETLRGEGVDTSACIQHKALATPSKNRLVANGQQLVRLDREQQTFLTEEERGDFLAQLDRLLPTMDLVVLSDYGKGFFSPAFLQEIFKRAKSFGLRVLVDPKGIDFTRYAGATLVKPNMGEAVAAAGLGSDAPLDLVAKRLLEITRAQLIMITRAQEGAALFYDTGERQDFPVLPREVKDVTGAGDTVLAMLACALASGVSYQAAAELCNHAAGIAIERFGCAKVSLSDIVQRLLADQPRYKLFDADHLFVVHEALNGREVVLLVLDAHLGISPALYRWMREVASQPQVALVVYVRGTNFDEALITSSRRVSVRREVPDGAADDEGIAPAIAEEADAADGSLAADRKLREEVIRAFDEGLIDMLISLREVAFIIYQGVDLDHICDMIEPKQTFIFEQGAIAPYFHDQVLV